MSSASEITRVGGARSEAMLSNSRIGKAYPLLRIFLFLLLPILVAGSIGLAVTLHSAISASAEKLFAKQEIRLVRTMLLADGLLGSAASPSAAMLTELGKELGETGISCLVVMKKDGSSIIRMNDQTSCATVKPADFEDVTAGGIPALVDDLLAPGHWTSLGSIALPGSTDRVLVAATRRSLSLESAISDSAWFWTMIFATLFTAALAATTFVVARAQRSIDTQAAYVLAVHHRLRRFLPVAAVRSALDAKSTPQRFEAVVMFVDLRDFSSFAEKAEPVEVASLIDVFVTRVAGAVSRHDGEVDKIVGDGIMAVFRGDDATANAIDAAVASITACHSLVRRPGFGIFKGEVIATELGTGHRADFTILGRTVNLASRLCFLAKEDEIALPEGIRFPQRPDLVEIGRVSFRPRHHNQSMNVVRYRIDVNTETP